MPMAVQVLSCAISEVDFVAELGGDHVDQALCLELTSIHLEEAMTTSSKPKSGSHTVQFRDTLDASSDRSKEALETFSDAANEANHVVQECCATALKGMQNYSGKIMQFTQANIKSHVEFVQKLASAKSPSEFIEMSTGHTRHQLETLAEQGKELAALAQQVTRDAAEQLKTGFAKPPLAPR